MGSVICACMKKWVSGARKKLSEKLLSPRLGQTLFSRLLTKERTSWLSPRVEWCAASPASSSQAHDGPSTYDLQKIILLSSSNALSGELDYFYWFRKIFHSIE